MWIAERLLYADTLKKETLMSDASLPASAQPVEPNREERWWIERDGRQDGPHIAAYLAVLLREGKISLATMTCKVGATDWQELHESDQLLSTLQSMMPGFMPPPIHQNRLDLAIFSWMKSKTTSKKLPSFANAICFYGLVVNPLLSLVLNFLLPCLSADWSSISGIDPNSPLIGYAPILSFIETTIFLSLNVALIVGAYQILQLRPIGATTIVVTIGLRTVIDLISLLISFVWLALIEVSGHSLPTDPEPSIGFGDLIAGLLLLTIILGSIAFEVTSLIWLLRNRFRIPHDRRTE
ncbi:hypothetical protein Psta_3699 [Pirellula staleyi DSM 6068]|uniref:GYF domain-containing protein n=1 Tax=Pirellula staleyi (strain ATCC 27377 / DSM 6068 / ICPB 4128) TaxID=530564 RepID=D2QZZ2_PIRSD|nr:hypothetical protein Psta_3699 [Pirellula staleyi DSM 6068]